MYNLTWIPGRQVRDETQQKPVLPERADLTQGWGPWSLEDSHPQACLPCVEWSCVLLSP